MASHSPLLERAQWTEKNVQNKVEIKSSRLSYVLFCQCMTESFNTYLSLSVPKEHDLWAFCWSSEDRHGYRLQLLMYCGSCFWLQQSPQPLGYCWNGRHHSFSALFSNLILLWRIVLKNDDLKFSLFFPYVAFLYLIVRTDIILILVTEDRFSTLLQNSQWSKSCHSAPIMTARV